MRYAGLVLVAVLPLGACGGVPAPTSTPVPPAAPSPTTPGPAATTSAAPSPAASGPAAPSPAASSPAAPGPAATGPGATGPEAATPSATPAGATPPPVDPRWRFFAREQRPVTSPWYDGAYRTMIDFGCSSAPYYAPDARCPGRQGFHHGVDVAMPCGVPLRAGVEGTVVLGGLGSAYGSKAFRIRTGDQDVVLGHVQQVLVRDGQRVRVGDVVAHNGDLGAPDGCHLHLEVRPRGGSVSSAVDPMPVARLVPAGT